MPGWSPDQVRALAPDYASLQAALKLASTRGWSQTGVGGEPDSVWGLCQGSGRSPYQTCVDLGEPAYRCSCPSRKSPCKHALALLLLWSRGEVKPAAEQPAWVREWQQGRVARGARKEAAGSAPRTEAQERAAAKRAAARQRRVASGVAELRAWLADQVRHGIAGMDQSGYKQFETLAARLVDAQAPGLASAVQGVATIPASGPGWEERLLTEFGMLHLLTTAAQAELPDELAAVARTRVGQTVPTEQVLATPPVRDVWRVIGVRDSHEDRLSVRRAWLIGAGTGREALVLSFAAAGQALSSDLLAGQAVDADLCFYPGIRALVAARHADRPWEAEGCTVAQALRRLTEGLAEDPWLQGWPMLLRGSVVPGERWHLVDPAGDALPLDARCGDQWRFLAASGGAEAVIAAEWSWAGLIPLTMFLDGQVIQP